MNRVLLATCSLLAISVFATRARADVPTGARASSARAEAEAFAALEEKRPCDAARSFLRAHELAPDERLVVNAALALQRSGARAEALTLFTHVKGTPAAVVADVDARILAIEADIQRDGPGQACQDVRASNALAVASHDAFANAAEGEGNALLPAGIAALASGLVVAGSTAGTVVWLQGVTNDPTSSGDAKQTALDARDPVLFAGSSLAGALVVAGAVLVPLSLAQEQP